MPPKAYLIGGAPRTGKSTLAELLGEHLGLTPISTDDLRTQIRKTITRSSEPDLYYLDSLNADEAHMARLMRKHTASIIAAADRESAVVWRTVEAAIRTNLGAGRSLIIEGVAVLPKSVSILDLNCTALYLGNQSPAHAQSVLDYARAHPDTWLGSLKPDTVSAFAIFSRAYSIHVEREARKHHQTYIEMSTQPFEQGLDLALSTIIPGGVA